MKLTKRIFSALLASLLMLGAFSGCAGEPAKESSAPKEAAAASVAADSAGNSTPAEVKGTVNVWTWEPYENQKAIIEDFNKAYPDVTIEFTTVTSEDMPMKVQTALASDSDIPDVVWSEIGSRGKMMALDCWEDLSQAPYNIDPKEMLDYQIPVSETPSGKLAGIEVSTPVAGLAYKRSLAKEYFGTDDPAKLAELFPTWDAMIEKGKEVSAKSNNKVRLFTS
ncbi:MAG: extracellular solute-binding protein, partial [Oscillospiraceae bacterium]